MNEKDKAQLLILAQYKQEKYKMHLKDEIRKEKGVIAYHVKKLAEMEERLRELS